MKKVIEIANSKYTISLESPVSRLKTNPMITCHDVNAVWKEPHLKVMTVHNAGAAYYNNLFHVLFRSHLRNGISVIGCATSENGISDWEISEKPLLKPCSFTDRTSSDIEGDELVKIESGGVEDPRICEIDNRFYITYSAYHGTENDSVKVCLATTDDFKSIKRFGPMLDKEMRNVVIFPEKINNKYYALFRPNDNNIEITGGKYSEIKLGFTDSIESNKWDLVEKPIMKQSGAPSSFGNKIGPGATPIKTRHGWLNIFHGVRKTMDGNPYVLGVALHELDDPSKVKVSNIPILFPSRSDCNVNSTDYVHVPNVVFTCGALRLDDGTIFIYYGGNDTVLNLGFSHEDILAELCNRYPQDIETGKPQYDMFQ